MIWRILLVECARTPTVSREFAYATTPERETSPYDGLKPKTPQYAAGSRIEPPVSVPRALQDVRRRLRYCSGNQRPTFPFSNRDGAAARTASGGITLAISNILNGAKCRIDRV